MATIRHINSLLNEVLVESANEANLMLIANEAVGNGDTEADARYLLLVKLSRYAEGAMAEIAFSPFSKELSE